MSREAARLVEQQVRHVAAGQDPTGALAANDVAKEGVVFREHDGDPPGLRALKQPVDHRRVKASGGAASAEARRHGDGGENIRRFVGGIERHVSAERLTR